MLDQYHIIKIKYERCTETALLRPRQIFLYGLNFWITNDDVNARFIKGRSTA